MDWPLYLLEEQLTDVIDNEIEDAVTEATSEDVFDALAFFSGAALPEDTVTVYADSAAAYRLSEIHEKLEDQKRLEKAEGLGITDEAVYADDDEVEELRTRLEDSAVRFKLRGLAPSAKTAIEKKVRATSKFVEGEENTEYNEAFNASLIASTITAVSNAKGKTDSKKWDADRVLAWSKVAAESEFSKLYLGVLKVNYIGDAVDRAVNADFS